MLNQNVTGLGIVTLDFVVDLDKFPVEGTKNALFDEYNYDLGGPIPNALVTLKRLDIDASFCGAVPSERLKHFLQNEGINLDYATHINDEIINVIIRTDTERTVLCNRLSKDKYLKETKNIKSAIDYSDILVVDGLEKYVSNEACKYAKKLGKLIVLGTESVSRAVSLMEYSDIMVVPESVMKEITGEDCIEKWLNYLKRTQLNEAIITIGSRGSLGYQNGHEGFIKCPSFEVDVKDTTGAGDSFLGAVTYSKIKGYDLKKTMLVSNAVGALNVTKKGSRGGLPNKEEMKDFLYERVGVEL